jgi:hypothetical protein
MTQPSMTAAPQDRIRSWWRGGLPRANAAAAAGITGTVSWLLVQAAALLMLRNVYGPFGEAGARGTLAAFACSLLVGAAMAGLGYLVGRRSRAGLVVLLTALVATAWVLYPRQVDVTESFVDQPNPRWSCSGWSFTHYPPGTFDASSVTYCVGLEHRIADG